MRIFWVDPFHSRTDGGGATYSNMLREALPQHEHIMWLPDTDSRFRKLLYLFLDSRMVADVLSFVIHIHNPDVVHVNLYTLARGAIQSKKPVVLTYHGPTVTCGSKLLDPFLKAYTGLRKTYSLIYKAQWIIVPSRYVASTMAQTDRVTIIPHVPKVVEPDPETHLFSQLLYVGRPAVEKGFPMFCNIPNYTKAAAVLSDAAFPHLNKFWNNADPATLSALYRQAELVVIPSRIPESFSYVAAEARAYGCRILASQQGGIADVLKDYPSATFLPVGFSQDQLNRAVAVALKKQKSPPTVPSVAEWAERHEQIYRSLTIST